MKNKINYRILSATAVIETIFILMATLGMQFLLFGYNSKLKYTDIQMASLTDQIDAYLVVNKTLEAEIDKNKELENYPVGEKMVAEFINKLNSIAKNSNSEIYRVNLISIVPIDISNSGDGTTPAVSNKNSFSRANVNVQLLTDYSGMLKFLSSIREMKDIVGVDSLNLDLPFDSDISSKKFVNLPLFIIFKTN